jgi:hypothetical protein
MHYWRRMKVAGGDPRPVRGRETAESDQHEQKGGPQKKAPLFTPHYRPSFHANFHDIGPLMY